MNGHLPGEAAIATVVTQANLEEYLMMRYSFDLFHGSAYSWFIRCDQISLQTLAGLPNTHCEPFIMDRMYLRPVRHSGDEAKVLDDRSPQFRKMLEQRMRVVGDAWKRGECNAVLLLDPCSLIVAPLVAAALAADGDVVFAPFHRSRHLHQDQERFGAYNAGFLLIRNRTFHDWWRQKFLDEPWKFADQQCLEDARHVFKVGELPASMAFGLWRRNADFSIPPIQSECAIVYLHLFQPTITTQQFVRKTYLAQEAHLGNVRHYDLQFTAHQLLHKSLGLATVKFLASSRKETQRNLAAEIARRDKLQFYAEAMK